MAHPVRVGQQPPQGARVEAPAPRRQKQRVLRAPGQLGARLMQVTGQPVRGLLAQRNHALFASLAPYVNELLLEVDVPEIQVDGFATPESRGVDELAQGTVSQAERAVPLQPGELRVDVRRLRSLGQPPWPLRRKRHI